MSRFRDAPTRSLEGHLSEYRVNCIECGYPLLPSSRAGQCPECGTRTAESIRASIETPLRFSSRRKDAVARIYFVAICFGVVALAGTRVVGGSASALGRAIPFAIGWVSGAFISSSIAAANTASRRSESRAHTRIPGAATFVVFHSFASCAMVLHAIWCCATSRLGEAVVSATMAVLWMTAGVASLAIYAFDLTPGTLVRFSLFAAAMVLLLLLC